MDAAALLKTWTEYRQSLYDQGILDNQFLQLESLKDETNPDFVAEVVNIFFEDSERLLGELAKALNVQQGVDFKTVDAHVHQLKGSSASIGAARVSLTCITFRNFCEMQNVDGCRSCLQQVINEYNLVKAKLGDLLKLEEQIVAAGGSVPIVEL